MRKCAFFLSLIVHLPCMASEIALGPLKQDVNELSLMTAYDLSNSAASSNLNLTNNAGQALTVFGIYVYGIAWINPGEDCTTGVFSGNSMQYQGMAGAIASPIPLAVGQSVPIGQNYLYNMVYTWFYWWARIGSTPPCELPGCTWTTDTQPYNWCLQIGAASPQSSYTYSPSLANVPPFAWPTDSSGNNYAYDLIPNTTAYTWLGPFTCSDTTLTCSTAVPQFQSFQP